MTSTSVSSDLALHGGTPTVGRTAPRPKRWSAPELAQLEAMLEQNSLFYWNGPQTRLLVERFQAHYPLEYIMPCSSGTAALHIAVLAAGIMPGDEVIVPPITDMGTVIGVLYQGGVPVFADVEPDTYNLDPLDVARKITPRTRAIIAVHLAGSPCDLETLGSLCDEHDLVLIEDCAQAWGAQYRGKPVGTLGQIGCYSLNDFKHIGCGDGGIVASSDPRFGPHLQLCGDKSYNRAEKLRFPEMLAPNYRISEPQSAVAAAQMERMPAITAKRGALGHLLTQRIQHITGLQTPQINDLDDWTCWFYMLRIDTEVFGCDNRVFAQALNAEGVPCSSGYIQVPLYKYPVFQNQTFFGNSWPVKAMGLTTMNYRDISCPQAEAILESCVQIPINQAMDEEWIAGVAQAIHKISEFYKS